MFPHYPIGAKVRAAFHATAVASLVLSAGGAAGAFAAPLTLEDAVRLALERAPQLQASLAGVTSATQAAHAAGRLPDPMLMLGVENFPITGADAFDIAADGMTMRSVGMRQDFPAGARRRAERVVAARAVDRAQADVATTRLAVRRATAEAWIAAWAAKRELAALEALHEQAVTAAKLARARVASGESVVDAMAADAALVELDGTMIDAQAAATQAGIALQRWTGDDTTVAGSAAPDFTTLPQAPATLADRVDHLPALRAAAAEVELAAAGVEAARAAWRPDWNVTVSYGNRRAGLDDMATVEFAVALPFLSRARRSGDIGARRALLDAARAAREDLAREASAAVQSAIAAWQGNRQQVALAETHVLPLARDRSAAALAGYRAGGALRPWLEARRDELAALRAYARQLADLGRAWAALACLIEESQS